MSDRTVLLPTDLSPQSNVALEYATILARDADARLLILHVEEPLMNYGGGEAYFPPSEPNTQAIEKALRAVVPSDSRVRYEHRLALGSPADTILNVAREEDADMIVMSTHGRTGLKRFLMGSVAEVVVREANCPVLTVKVHAPSQPGSESSEAARANQ